MSELLGTAWPLPVGGIIFAIVGYIWLRAEGARLDRKYGK